ncbi:hypothetical protein SDRG_10546 [Saprolegnia diclina VS20]|uniref:VPS9 domain-containing protein n=1 Tax=Saprolegnia diclina (strain VS20) TaxID=1156394 RepID=T0RNW7_SAPDV|nr:hypothetical protein SDRG_10546 [Saprolegnia diclina VS20]EQC31757.1 hypothetical protein SDRG_10546 [Saprolegnia diclina VS20]|eukprot:XP_008614764.1 hypothetical protein SDRG_10546 [Saprolegnia diclina VS20]
MEEPLDVGAPDVWVTPGWTEYPIMENFYAGGAMDVDLESPYDVVFSPDTKAAFAATYDAGFERPEEDSDTSMDEMGELSAVALAETPQERRVSSPPTYAKHRRMTTIKDLSTPTLAKTAAKSSAFTTDALQATADDLRAKLEQCLDDVASKLTQEYATYEAYELSTLPPPPPQPSLFSFLCAPQADPWKHFDGLRRLCDLVTTSSHHRTLNQLTRHKRHVQRLLHTVLRRHYHVHDMALTAKELATFESIEMYLEHDLKLHLLSQQREWLQHLDLAREQAKKDASAHAVRYRHPSLDVDDAYPHNIRHGKMRRLLEAASWYRLLQQSAGLGRSPHGTNLSVVESSSNASPTELPRQQSVMDDVLAGEEFYAEYYELMNTKEWWSVVQAQFENLIFAAADNRICHMIDRVCFDGARLACEDLLDDSTSDSTHPKKVPYVDLHHAWLRDPTPDHVLEFIEAVTLRVRREFGILDDVNKSLYIFMQRALFPRLVTLCYSTPTLVECARKDALWRKKQASLRLAGVSMEQFGVTPDLAQRIRDGAVDAKMVFPAARLAFSAMGSLVPCDLLEEMIHGVVVLHEEAAKVFGTTRIAVDTFFPLLSYVLLHADIPYVHAHLYLLEHFALAEMHETSSGDHPNRNGEESYYVYCMHAAVEAICSFARPPTIA